MIIIYIYLLKKRDGSPYITKIQILDISNNEITTIGSRRFFEQISTNNIIKKIICN